MNNRQENATVSEGTGDQEFTVDNPGSNLAANENLVEMRTLERCFKERIDIKMGNIVDTVEDWLQNVIFTAIDSFITPIIELAIRPINASFGQDATSVVVNSERGKHIEITAHFENVYERNNTLHVFNTNDEKLCSRRGK